MNAQAHALTQQVAQYLAAGGRIEVLPGFRGIAPLPPRTSSAAAAPRKCRRSQSVYQQMLSMRDELLALSANHSARQVSALKGIPEATLREFARDHGFTFRSVAARTFTPEEVAHIKALARRMNITQAAVAVGIGRRVLQRLAEVEGFRFRDGREDGITNLILINMGADKRTHHTERIQAMQAIGLTERQALGRSGLGGRVFRALCKQAGITWARSEGRD